MSEKVKKISRERNMTAAEAAKRFGCSPRTIRNIVALDRKDYLNRAAERRELAFKLRSHGKSWVEIGEALACSAEAARALHRRYLALLKEKQTKKEKRQAELVNLSLFEEV